MSQPTPTQVAILIGGRSTRMGRDKALIERGGVPQVLHLSRLLAPFSARAPLWVGPPSAALRRHPCATESATSPWVPDRGGDRGERQGPLAGLVGLVDHCRDADFLVVAVDMFGLAAEAVQWLLAQRAVCRERGRFAVWPRLPERPFGEPLCAWYQRDALMLMAEHFTLGERALHRALPAGYRHEVAVPAALIPCFANINEPEALSLFVRE